MKNRKSRRLTENRIRQVDRFTRGFSSSTILKLKCKTTRLFLEVNDRMNDPFDQSVPFQWHENRIDRCQ